MEDTLSGWLCCTSYGQQNMHSADGSVLASFLNWSVGLAHVTKAQIHVLLDRMCLYNRGIVISNQTTDKHRKILKCPIFPPSLIQSFFSSNRSFTETVSKATPHWGCQWNAAEVDLQTPGILLASIQLARKEHRPHCAIWMTFVRVSTFPNNLFFRTGSKTEPQIWMF